jgi:hypothetical protein
MLALFFDLWGCWVYSLFVFKRWSKKTTTNWFLKKILLYLCYLVANIFNFKFST